MVLGENEGNAEASKTGENDKKDIGKLFEKKASGTDVEAAKASASIGAVSGADVLQAIAKSSGTADNNKNIKEVKYAAGIAAAKAVNDKKEIKDPAKKDAVIAAVIALRAMAKDGKFAAKGDEKSANAVNGAVASAVNKMLSTLTIAIRNRVDEGLKGISEILGEIKQGEGFEAKVSE
ncbi:Variable outer membrane protein [Borrelia duttonii CR2A]|uniref:Variable large protein n=1 Tax=Borrelia duttonii CR2A TaxID=1432657 RepID=W6TG72_9SPIR|nr:Variable outer membrane protein [Borrelia duttonii CR2A]